MQMPTRQELIAAGLGAAGLGLGTVMPLWALHWLGVNLDSAHNRSPVPTGFLVYYKVIALKGLLPQFTLSLALHPWLRRFRRKHAGRAEAADAAEPDRLTQYVETFIVASIAYCAVVSVLLTVDWPGWPALQMRGPADQIGTFLGMTTAVTLAIRLSARESSDSAPARSLDVDR